MKNLIKKLKFPVVALMIALLVALPFSGFTATISRSLTSGVPTNLVSVAGTITRITLSGTAGTVKVQLFDAPAVALTYVIGAYTNYTPTVYTNAVVFTDILGASVTNNHKYITNLATANIQTTNLFRSLGQFSVPAGETITINYDTVNVFNRGILITNNGAIDVTINYLPQE